MPGWSGAYEVSSLGRVRSLDREVRSSDGRSWLQPGKVLTPVLDFPSGPNGPCYQRVVLRYGGRRQAYRIHELVLTAFVGPRPAGMEACHGGLGPTDNRLSNLRWDTHSGNVGDQVRAGTHNNASKTHCKNGHEFTPENTAPRENGGRRCITCRRNDWSRRSQRQKLTAR
ncbi:HNH endonuclease [Mycobacterium phage Pound]|nr:HNH endonuclease [Mycobacterium phage Pound]WNM72606.1 HNH endonuclease [Mycobacterium phage Bombitas]